jgi:hypothetical protein
MMATEKRTSEQGTVFDRAIVRDFLLTALEHDAVTARVNALLLDHSTRSEGYTVDAEDFKRLLTEVLSAAWYIDWEWVAQTLKATHGDNAASTDQSSDAPEVIDVETPPLTAARRLLRKLCNQGGAAYIESTQGNEYEGPVVLVMRGSVTLHDRRTNKPATIRLLDIEALAEIDLGRRNLFVRPLASEEVHSLTFILPDQQTDDLDARTQAAILLGSNAGCTTSQIAAMLAVEESKVCQVITGANEQGLAGVLVARRAEREHVIKTARDLDPEGFDADTRQAHPGKFEGASDLQLVVALDVLNGYGLADENTGNTAFKGYAWRVNRFVGIEDSQGFVTAEEWPIPRLAKDRLRDFDTLDVGDGSADEQEA